MAAYVRRQLGPAARPGDEPRVVRLDRYLLHPLLCHRCVGHPA